MDLSNMLMQQLKGKALEQIASQVWGDSAMTKTIAAKALPMILGQLSKNTETPEGAESLNNALNGHLGESKVDVNDGMKILGHMFGNKDTAVWEVAKTSGATAAQTEWVMWALSSVVMESLWDQKKAAGWFGANDLMKMLSGTGKDGNMFALLDQDWDGDFDKSDAMKFGFWMLKKKFFGGK